MDHLTSEKRSWNMSRIRSADTKPEIIFRKALFKAGYRYRLHNKTLPGRPDLVLKKYRTAVFVHGCFWHRHPGCSRAAMPKTNQNYWQEKFAGNICRDKQVQAELETMNYRVFIIWECELKNADEAVKKITDFIRKTS